jgi:hypothetical protein
MQHFFEYIVAGVHAGETGPWRAVLDPVSAAAGIVDHPISAPGSKRYNE